MTALTGPYRPVRHGTKWTVEFCLDDNRRFPIWTSPHDAQAHAHELNQQYQHTHTPRPPQPAQPGLFDDAQEAI